MGSYYNNRNKRNFNNFFGKLAINNLMFYIAIGNVIVLLFDTFFGSSSFSTSLSQLLYLDPALVLKGQVWRIVTFVFIPTGSNIFFALISIYFYYFIGTTLESIWKSSKFTLYYLLGILSVNIAAFIAYFILKDDPIGMISLTGNLYNAGSDLNSALFLACAYIMPDFQILAFFFIPLKMKYMAWFSGAIIFLRFLTVPLIFKLVVFSTVVNFFVYFGKDLFITVKNLIYRNKNKVEYKAKTVKFSKGYFHKCVVCGKTENDDKKMEFRYCAKCNGNYEYCMEHLYNHQHKV